MDKIKTTITIDAGVWSKFRSYVESQHNGRIRERRGRSYIMVELENALLSRIQGSMAGSPAHARAQTRGPWPPQQLLLKLKPLPKISQEDLIALIATYGLVRDSRTIKQWIQRLMDIGVIYLAREGLFSHRVIRIDHRTIEEILHRRKESEEYGEKEKKEEM